MRLRGVLFSVVRLCQCSGLCPISVYGPNTKQKKIAFASVTAIIFILQLLMCIHLYVYSENLYWPKSTLLPYISWVVTFTMRLHAAIILIESCANRSIQSKLFDKLDDIATIFNQKLRMKTDEDRLRGYCHRFIIAWIVKILLVVCSILMATMLSPKWQQSYRLGMTLAPFCTTTLFSTQLMLYLDTVKYNIETTNEGLMKLMDSPRIVWHRHQRHIMLSTHKVDVCEQLVHLRECYCKTWEASMLINRCVRWSLMVGVTNDFIMSITNLYWMLYCTLHGSFDERILLIIATLWVVFIMAHFMLISRICDQISEQVSS